MSDKSKKKPRDRYKKYTVQQLSEITVGELMSTGVTTVSPDDSLQHLQDVWIRHDFDTFPVVDNGRLEGIVSKIDFLNLLTIQPSETKAIPIAFKVMATKVKDIMKREFYTVTKEDTVTRAITLIVENRLRSLPVVSDGKLIGMVSRMDIIRCVHLETPGVLR